MIGGFVLKRWGKELEIGSATKAGLKREVTKAMNRPWWFLWLIGYRIEIF